MASPSKCFVCNLAVLVDEEKVAMFTCEHGKVFHNTCAVRWYDALPFEKRCVSFSCNQAQLINPRLGNALDYQNIWALVQNAEHPVCTICNTDVLPDSCIGLLQCKPFRYATCGKRVAHATCHFLYPTQTNMTIISISLEMTDITSIVEMVRLFIRYPKRRQFPIETSNPPMQKINRQQNADLLNLIVQYNCSDPIHEQSNGIKHTTCIICTNSIPNTPHQCTLPCNHHLQMHSNCLAQWLSLHATCPICRQPQIAY